MAGAAAWAGILVVSLFYPASIDRAAEGFLVRQVERQLGGEFGAGPPGARLEGLARSVPAEARDLRVLRGERLREVIGSEPAGTGIATEESTPGLTFRSHGAYRQLLSRLAREIRIFAGCNSALFAFTTLLAGSRRRHAPSLVLPSGILCLATCIAGASYLLAKDWFWAFLTSSYLGYGYLGLVTFVAGLLADVAWNEARISSAIARALWHWQPG